MLSKFKWATLMGFACFIIVVTTAFVGVSQSSQPSVQLVTEPAIADITPLEAEATKYLGSGKANSPVQLKLQARDAAGKPLENAQFHLQILAPAPTPWFTTDFPVVEGTKLLDITAKAPKGEFLIQQLFPIRGNYQVQVNVTPSVENTFAPMAQTLNLSVPENPLKIAYFPIVLGILLAIGFVGGWIIGAKQELQAGEVAPRQVRLLLSGVTVLAIAALLFFNINAELSKTHDHGGADASADYSGLIQSQGLQLELTGDRQTAVGQLASFQAKLTDSKTNLPVNDVTFAIKSTQLENNWIAFGYQGVPDQNGVLTWQEQFFDGSPHKVEVAVLPNPNSNRQFASFLANQEVDVENVAPPIFIRLIGWFYFTSVLVLGLGAGLWLQKRRSQRI
jgi:hypothetical protein